MKAFFDLLFPRRCPVCADIVQPRGALICPDCIKKLDPVREPVCRKCGKQLISDRAEYCYDCSRRARSYEAGRAVFKYNQAAKKSLTAIKYKNRREYLDFYTQAMAYRYQHTIQRWQPEVLVPIPVHPSRMRTRGFNQAEELSRRLSDLWGIPTQAHLLIRVKKTLPQKKLTPEERLKNLQQAFAVRPPMGRGEAIPETVVLVDDIYTTGSTMEACTRVLKAAGVKKVYFLTICIGYG
jgi:ComF family protein